MLSIHKIGAADAKGAAAYYSQLGQEDYYHKGGEPPGQWLGAGALYLGLRGQVKEGELERAFQGLHPRTGEPLVANAGPRHAPGWDCTFSAPKSVSAVWAVSDRETRTAIARAHDEAVKAGLQYLERQACFTRHGQGGQEREPALGVVAAAYQHCTSRAQDPQLHTHVLVHNLAPDASGGWRNLDLDTHHKMMAGSLYRCELAHQLQRLGYVVQRDGASFKLEGVPNKLTEQWSSRTREIERRAADKGHESYKATREDVVKTREHKSEVDRAALHTKWEKEAKEIGFGREHAHELRGREPAQALPAPDPARLLERATEQASTVSRLQLAHLVAREAQGALPAKEAEALVAKVAAHPECIQLQATHEGRHGTVRLQARYSTKEMVALEMRMAERAQALAAERSHQAGGPAPGQTTQGMVLSTEQRSALAHVCEPGRLACVQGDAGTGKSLLLGAAREAWVREGYEVKGAALSAKAAQGLERSSGIAAQTVHSLMKELESGKTQLTGRDVVVVDEAGMIGSRQMEKLLSHVDRGGAKLVLVGDSKQLQPIDAGGAFRAIVERVGAARLEEIQRQHGEMERQTVRSFRDGQAGQALEQLQAQGRLHLGRDRLETMQQAVGRYVEDLSAGRSSLMLAATRSDARELNALAREAARDRGLLGTRQIVAETAHGAREFSVGDRVLFTRNDRDLQVRNGTTALVEKVGDARLSVRLDDGSTRLVNLREYNHMEHGYALTVHKAQGTSVDRAHVLAGEMGGREWSYVAASRAREETHLYASREQLGETLSREALGRERDGESIEAPHLEKSELAREMGQAHQKDTTLDHSR